MVQLSLWVIIYESIMFLLRISKHNISIIYGSVQYFKMKVRLSLKRSLNLFRSHVDNVYFGERLRTFSGNEETINEQSGSAPNRSLDKSETVRSSGKQDILKWLLFWRNSPRSSLFLVIANPIENQKKEMWSSILESSVKIELVFMHIS